MTLFKTQFGFESLTFLAVVIRGVNSGVLLTMNHGSTAIQCPPTPGPGCKILTLGCLLLILISSQTFIPRLSHITDNSFAKAIPTSREAFSVSFAISAVFELVIVKLPLTNVLYISMAANEHFGVMPPITRSLSTNS